METIGQGGPPAKQPFIPRDALRPATAWAFLRWLVVYRQRFNGQPAAWIGLGVGVMLLNGTVLQRYRPDFQFHGTGHGIAAACGVVVILAVYLCWYLATHPELWPDAPADD